RHQSRCRCPHAAGPYQPRWWVARPESAKGVSRSRPSRTQGVPPDYRTPLTSGYCRYDVQLIAFLHRRGEIVQIADVLVIEIDIDEAAKLTVLKDPLRHRRK